MFRLYFTIITGFCWMANPVLSGQSTSINKTLKGKVLYQSSGNKPAVGIHVKEKDSNGAFSDDNGEYRLIFQTKRNGDALALEVESDNKERRKIELVNEKEVKAAKLPANPDDNLDIIVCFAGQRDFAAQKYYNIIKTTRDIELAKLKKEYDLLIAEEKLDGKQIEQLYKQLDKKEKELDSVKIREQALTLASINIDRSSARVKEALRKLENEQDVEGALEVLDSKEISKSWRHNSEMKKQHDLEIKQAIEAYKLAISLLQPRYRYLDIVACYDSIIVIFKAENYDKLTLATLYGQAGLNLNFSGNYLKCLEYNLKALKIYEELPDKNDLELGILYNNISIAFSQLGQYDKQLEYNKKSLSIFEENLPESKLNLVILYGNLAETFGNLHDYELQLTYGEKAFNFFKNQQLTDSILLAQIFTNIAKAYENLGFYEKQLENNLKALKIFEKKLPDDHPDLGTSYSFLAASYGNLKEYQKQLAYNLKALSIFEKALGADHPSLSIFYMYYAASSGNLNDYPKQLELSQKALKILKKVTPVNKESLALGYISLGVAYGNLKEFQKQLDSILMGLSIFENIYGKDNLNLATYYSITADAYQKAGNLDKAIEYAEKTLALALLFNPPHPGLNRFYAILGIAYLKVRRFPEAKIALEKSEALEQEARVYRGWAMYYALQNSLGKAIANLQKAVELGFNDLIWIETEPDLKNIHNEPAYKEIVAKLRKEDTIKRNFSK